MRHLGLRKMFGVLALGALAVATGIGSAGGMDRCAAAPLDFLFGGPPLASRSAYRLRRRPTRQLAQRQPHAEIPLPVARPHFPDDPPAGTMKAQTVPSTATATPSGAGIPAETPPAGTAGAPLPPPKPADLGKATEPATAGRPTAPPVPRSEVKTEPSKPEPTEPVSAETAKIPAAPPPEAPQPPPKPPKVVKPDTTKPGAPPAVAPSGATTAFVPRSPDDDPQCPARLQARHVDVAHIEIGPQPDAPLHGGRGGAARRSQPARRRQGGLPRASDDRLHDGGRLLVLCARPAGAARQGHIRRDHHRGMDRPGLECRSRDHIFGAKLSAHGQGLAIDIAQLKLADGRLIEVGDPKTEAETGFETAARAGACGYFHTVLGPGSDEYHRTHWHFDLEVRGSHGDSKYCK